MPMSSLSTGTFHDVHSLSRALCDGSNGSVTAASLSNNPSQDNRAHAGLVNTNSAVALHGRVASLSFQEENLPLQLPLTTGAANKTRQVIRLHLSIRDSSANILAEGTGEVAPLPGELHTPPDAVLQSVDSMTFRVQSRLLMILT